MSAPRMLRAPEPQARRTFDPTLSDASAAGAPSAPVDSSARAGTPSRRLRRDIGPIGVSTISSSKQKPELGEVECGPGLSAPRCALRVPRRRIGVYNGAAVVISSGTGLNDGAWHMATATLGAAGMHLYIDGVQVAQNLATTVGEATTGFWRVGCGNLSGWGVGWTGPNPPPASATASNYVFNGSVDEATVFTTQLTASQIAFLYWIR